MSLVDQACSPYIFDTNHFENLLSANSERTLVADDQLQIKLIEVGEKGILHTYELSISKLTVSDARLGFQSNRRSGNVPKH
jgi:hypothetical protein